MSLFNLWSQFHAFLSTYVVGFYYSMKQLLWKTNKNVKRPASFQMGLDGGSNVELPVALITGGTKGIGLQLAKLLVQQKFAVILVARNKEDGQNAVETLKKLDPNGQVEFHSVDISDLNQLNSFLNDQIVAKRRKLHLLVNNAALMMIPYTSVPNAPYELQWAVNVVALIKITETLLPLIKKAADEDGLGRIVNLSSSSSFCHQLKRSYFEEPLTSDKYSCYAAYANSKIAVVLYTRYLQERLSKEESKVTAYSLHPGVISTDLYQHMSWLNRKFFGSSVIKGFLRSTEDAAWDLLYLCLKQCQDLEPGSYYENNVVTRPANVDNETREAFEVYVRNLVKKN